MNSVMMPDEYGATTSALGAYSVRIRECAVKLADAVADFDNDPHDAEGVLWLVGTAEFCSELLVELSRAVMIAGEQA